MPIVDERLSFREPKWYTQCQMSFHMVELSLSNLYVLACDPGILSLIDIHLDFGWLFG